MGEKTTGVAALRVISSCFIYFKYMTISFAIPMGLCIAKLLYSICFSAPEVNYKWFHVVYIGWAHCTVFAQPLCMLQKWQTFVSNHLLWIVIFAPFLSWIRQPQIKYKTHRFAVRNFFPAIQDFHELSKMWFKVWGHTDEQEKALAMKPLLVNKTSVLNYHLSCIMWRH